MKLERPLITFDIESTGTNPAKDRIISLAAIKTLPGRELDERLLILVNPGIPIPPESTEIHGITDADVQGRPLFADEAAKVLKFFEGCDVCGYNASNFDVPMLWEELYQAGYEWNTHGMAIVDPGTIFKKKEERTLTAAVHFYCSREHVDAHCAMEDAKAAEDVLFGQLRRYPDLAEMSITELSKFSNQGDRIDLAGKIVRDKDGDPAYALKSKEGVKVKNDIGFAHWMLGKDFPTQTKLVLQKILKDLDVEEDY